MEDNSKNEQEFVSLIFDDRYELSTSEPWNIRRKGSNKCLKQFISNVGYLYSSIKGQTIHRLVALQFITNDDPDIKTVVDHINRNKLDNRLENLRWVSPKDNALNRDKRENVVRQQSTYLEKLPDNVVQIDEYKNFQFERYYYDRDNNRIIMITKDNNIKVVKPMPKDQRIVMTDIYYHDHKFTFKNVIEFCDNNF